MFFINSVCLWREIFNHLIWCFSSDFYVVENSIASWLWGLGYGLSVAYIRILLLLEFFISVFDYVTVANCVLKLTFRKISVVNLASTILLLAFTVNDFFWNTRKSRKIYWSIWNIPNIIKLYIIIFLLHKINISRLKIENFINSLCFQSL